MNNSFARRIAIFVLITKEKMKRLEKAPLPTKYGDFEMYAYKSDFKDFPHVVLFSKTAYSTLPAVRVHSECMTGDVFSSARCKSI